MVASETCLEASAERETGRPGAREADGSEARPEALRASARTGGAGDAEDRRGFGSPASSAVPVRPFLHGGPMGLPSMNLTSSRYLPPRPLKRVFSERRRRSR